MANFFSVREIRKKVNLNEVNIEYVNSQTELFNVDLPDFSRLLINWYQRYKRDLPWRHTNDPYRVWLSEVILQQTRVDQGLPYYQNFIREFPGVKDLALAPQEKIMKLWQGLGYYSRARNLHQTAKIVHDKHQGRFPEDYEGLLKLKGIGVYTAAAIASFCFNEPKAVIDGNVYRVLSRVFGIHIPIDSTAGKKEFALLAAALLNPKKAALHNQAIMEFGALQCVPRNPNCGNCPLQGYCYAYSSGDVGMLPVKEKKPKVTERYFEYFVLCYRNYTYIRRREGQDIWKHLYEFPLLETTKLWKETEVLQSDLLTNLLKETPYTLQSVSEVYRHVLSHQKIYARFWTLRLTKRPLLCNDLEQADRTKLENFAWPRLTDRYLQTSGLYKKPEW